MATLTESATLPTLQENDKGEAVRFLQQLLIAFGHLDKDYFNAVFDKDTETAVIKFQEDFNLKKNGNLKKDGIVGSNTWEALSKSFNSD